MPVLPDILVRNKVIVFDFIIRHRRCIPMGDDFYCRYYTGHKGQFGHEYMEFELYADGRLRYAVRYILPVHILRTAEPVTGT